MIHFVLRESLVTALSSRRQEWLFKPAYSCYNRETKHPFHSCRVFTTTSFSRHNTNEEGNNRRLVYVHSCSFEGEDGELGCPIAYDRGWAWQQVLLIRKLEYQKQKQQQVLTSLEAHDQILLLEHDPVYTLGRGADEQNLICLNKEPDGGLMARQKLSRKSRGAGSARLSMDTIDRKKIFCNFNQPLLHHVNSIPNNCSIVQAPNGASIYRVDRGGEVTFHGPGQLVAYPMFDLRVPPFKQDLHWYLRSIEDVIIDTLKEYDIQGERDDINTGVWVEKEKIAAVGVSSSRWITTHGLALNVNPDLSFFDTSVIIPCGIEGRGVTSIAKIMREREGGKGPSSIPKMKEVASLLLKNFERVFNVKTLKGDRII